MRAYMDKNESAARLEVDGGINARNIKDVSDAGADTFVLGRQYLIQMIIRILFLLFATILVEAKPEKLKSQLKM